MKDKITKLFESGNYKMAYRLMNGQGITMIDIDVNKLLKYDKKDRWHEPQEWFTSGIIPNRTHDFTVEIQSYINDGSLYDVWICDFRGNVLHSASVEDYANLLCNNASFKYQEERHCECWLLAISKEDVLNLLFKEPNFQ